ncbi:ion channel [Jannaschia sp. LMIT008]|uniref:ion channel n=1 Tax=Jannaschia maritima TaxID=3032585 RepID=UPI002811BFD7|nr:transporter substrate-binding domain-containing protein [Jannaschia sp. LMIT008]
MRILLSFALTAALTTGVAAQTVTPVAIGLIDAPPFAIEGAGGSWTGLAVDLFRLAADDLGLAPVFTGVDDVASGLEAGMDVVLPVEASPALEAAADLTHPVYTATLGVVSEREGRILSVVRGLASWEFVRLILGLSVLLLAVGAAVWAIERRSNEDMFHRSPARGLGDGFWWAGVTLTTIGYGDKAPATFWGRAVAMLWMLMGLAVSASLTAAVVTLANAGDAALSLPEDLRDRDVVVARDTAAAAYAERQSIPVRVVADAAEAVALVRDGAAEMALGSAPVLQHAADGAGLAITTTQVDPVLVSFAVPTADPLREDLNAALLRIIASETGQEIVRRYVGSEE